jgi:hypothetical protein
MATHRFDPEVVAKKTDAIAQMKLSNLANKSYSQVQSYIDTNVTDLTSAKTVIKKLAVLLLALLKERNLSS